MIHLMPARRCRRPPVWAARRGAGGSRAQRFWAGGANGWWWLAWIGFAWGWAGLQAELQGASFSEYEVKAAWLVNFARFVEWPEAAFRDTNAPLVIGVFGRDPFGKGLENAVEGQTVRGHRLLPKLLTTDADLKGCHILFLGAGERRRTRELTERLRHTAVLTVGETEEFLDQGGVVNFVLKENAVRFEINVKAAQDAKLRLDAKLLKVALAVRGRYE